VTPEPSIVQTQTPVVTTPDVVAQTAEPIVSTPAPETTPTVTPVTPTPTSDATARIDLSQLIEYKNTNFGYHFSMPKKVYYAGFGARDGASHTVAIQSEALPETFEDSTTRVLYYGKKVLPELKGTTRYVDPNGKYILLLLDGQYSVRIESDNLKSATVLAIEATIGVD